MNNSKENKTKNPNQYLYQYCEIKGKEGDFIIHKYDEDLDKFYVYRQGICSKCFYPTPYSLEELRIFEVDEDFCEHCGRGEDKKVYIN